MLSAPPLLLQMNILSSTFARHNLTSRYRPFSSINRQNRKYFIDNPTNFANAALNLEAMEIALDEHEKTFIEDNINNARALGCFTYKEEGYLVPIDRSSHHGVCLRSLLNTLKLNALLKEKVDMYHCMYYLCGQGTIINLEKNFPIAPDLKITLKEITEDLLWLIRGTLDYNTTTKEDIESWWFYKNIWMNKSLLYRNRLCNLEDFKSFYDKLECQIYMKSSRDLYLREHEQLASVIDKLNNGSDSAKIEMNCWNPGSLHFKTSSRSTPTVEFSVNKGRLDCILTQIPWNLDVAHTNIVSYSLLSCLLAQSAGLKRGNIHIKMKSIGSHHNITAPNMILLREKITKNSESFPCLLLNPTVKDILDFKSEDIKLAKYTKQ